MGYSRLQWVTVGRLQWVTVGYNGLQLGTRRLCWHNFEHNRYLKALSIMPA